MSTKQLQVAVLDIVAKRGRIGYGALVAQLQRRGFDRLADLWKLLDDLVADGELRREGPAQRPELVYVPPAPAPARPKASPPPLPPRPRLPVSAARRQAYAAPRRGRTSKHRHLTRIEAGPKQRPGYLVRVTWAKQRRAKFFADVRYGDQLGALAAALGWRDQVTRELGKPRTDRHAQGGARSNTGHAGVTRTVKGGHGVFQATWYEDGRQRRRVFNIEKLGERRALRAAIKARAEGEARRLASHRK